MAKSRNSKLIQVNLTLNGQKNTYDVPPDMRLLDFLRDAGLKSVKSGCGEGDCGMCTILLDGKPVKSCLLTMDKVDGKAVETL